MRRTTAALAVLALGASACAGSRPAGEPRASSPAPAGTSAPAGKVAEPAAVTPGSCPGTPRAADQLRPVEVRGSGWRLISLDDSAGHLADGSVTSDGALWALHGSPGAMGDHVAARRWDGRAWTRLPQVPGARGADQALSAVSRDAAWIVTRAPGKEDGARGPRTLWAWNGAAWRTAPLDLRPAPDDVRTSARGPWVVAGDRSMRWNGTRWQPAPLPAPARSLGGTDDEPWVVGELPPDDTDSDKSRVARWTGSAWQDVPLPELRLPPDAEPQHGDDGERFPRVAVRTGSAEFWVLGSFRWLEHDREDLEDVFPARPVAMRNVSGVWTCLWGPTGEPGFSDAVPDGSGGLWAVTDWDDGPRSVLWHLAGGRWTRESLPVRDGGQARVYDLAARDGTVYALGALVRDPLREGRAALWRLGR
ncbi:hypothetical protein ACIBG4_17045 [Nonomuraea sp. NPDC050383]|uniref:hypothetical protein n=1 Tax=Nonomuraea sp. NPDC050383 TaxID=3364362 RepID=UPI0037B8FCE0